MGMREHLVAYWPMTGASGASEVDLITGITLAEAGGGTAIGSTTGLVYPTVRNFTYTDGRYFSTSGDWAQLSGNSTTSIAFAAWVKATTLPDYCTILSKGWGPGNLHTEYIIYYNPGTQAFVFSISNYSGTAVYNEVSSLAAGFMTTGTKYLVFATYDPVANEITIRINNNVNNVASTSLDINDGSAVFNVGASPLQSLYWNGQIGPVMVWKGYIPTAYEQGWLYNAGNGRRKEEILAPPYAITT